MKTTAAALLLVTAFIPVSQDVEYVRAMDRAQAQRPATITAVAWIAPESEPGTPLVINGKVFGEDGKASVGGAIVFAYHTDRTGLYDKAGSPPHSWRLRGWARTNPDGTFEFRTIRPGAYPGNKIAAHVHFTVFSGNLRYHAGELQFENDPIVTADMRAASKRDGLFGAVRPVRQEHGTEYVDVALKLRAQDRF